MSTSAQRPPVVISAVQAMLKDGYTRWENEATEPGKSIQAFYSLTFSECKTVFAHPKVKGLKVRFTTLRIIDDTEGQNTVTEVTTDNTPVEEVVDLTPAVAVEEIMPQAVPVAVPEPVVVPVAVEPEPENPFDI